MHERSRGSTRGRKTFSDRIADMGRNLTIGNGHDDLRSNGGSFRRG
jgi:hypothetical protein